MSENTIFQGGQSSVLQPILSNNAFLPPPPGPPTEPPSPLLPPADDNESFFLSSHFTTFLKIGLAILVAIVGLVIIFGVILPLFMKKPEGDVKLVYWGLWEDKAVMQPLLDEFNRQNPRITIEYVQQDGKQYLDRIYTRIKNGTGPDIYRFHSSWVPQLSGYLLPFSTDVITKDAFQKGFYPVVQNDVVSNGAIYGIPYGIDTLSLFVNPEIFQAAGATVPTNWNDFIKVSRELTVKDETGKIKTSGAAIGAFDNVSHAPDILSMLFAQNGADMMRLGTTKKNAIDALDFYTSFVKSDGNVWDATLEQSVLSFAKGNVAMFFGYSWDIFTIKAINPNAPIAVHPVPRLPGRDMTVASYWVEGVSSKTKYPKEAYLFMKYIAQKETEQKLFAEQAKTRLFGLPYAHVELAPLLKENALLYPFVTQATTAVSPFFVSDTNDNAMNAQVNGYLGNAVRGILNNASSESVVETLSQGVSTVLSQYGL